MSAKGNINLREETDMRCSETGAPFYVLQYRSSSSNDKARAQSRLILSALKGGSDLIIELNSSLLVMPSVGRERQALDYQRNFEELGLEYRMRKSAAPPQSIFSLQGLLGRGQKSQTQYELLFFVPHDVWMDEAFQNLLPVNGCRYYVLREGVSGLDMMEKIFQGQLSGEARQNAMTLNIFDCSLLGQMGFHSYAFDRSVLDERLKELL